MTLCLFRIAFALAACTLTGSALAQAAQSVPLTPEQRLAAAGLTLPNPDPPVANFANAVQANNFLFLAGHGECGQTLKVRQGWSGVGD